MGKKVEDKSGRWFGDYYIIDRNYDKEYYTAHYNYECKCGEHGIIDVRHIKDDIKCQHNLICKICGKPASEDSHFYPAQQLCNRHYLQMRRHGDILSVEKERVFSKVRKCDVCGDEEHDRYYIWKESGEYKNKTLCGKHYNQMSNKGKITDPTPSEHRPRKIWTPQDEEKLRELYLDGRTIKEIADYFKITEGAASSKASEIGVTKEIIRPNNSNFKAVYQDYDWCYERFINRGMSMQEMAEEAGASLRVIQKWCQEIYNLDARSYKYHKKLNNIQKQLIMFSLLGDGHIDRREDQPMYIETHAENQKDYLYWKWSIIKDICNQEPVYYPPQQHSFGNDKLYECQAHYRLCTRIVDDLKPIRAMSLMNIIEQLNEFGLSIHFLDDASRSGGFWTLCVAGYSDEDVQRYLQICKERFNIVGKIRKDKRYIGFDKKSSQIIDNIILHNIPNELDIIQYKILKECQEAV